MRLSTLLKQLVPKPKEEPTAVERRRREREAFHAMTEEQRRKYLHKWTRRAVIKRLD